MKYYIKKYVILFLIIEFVSRLIPTTLKTFFPDIFTQEISKGVTVTFGIGYYISLTTYLLNFILVYFIIRDSKRLQLENKILFVLTIFSGFSGILIFLLLTFEKLKNEHKLV